MSKGIILSAFLIVAFQGNAMCCFGRKSLAVTPTSIVTRLTQDSPLNLPTADSTRASSPIMIKPAAVKPVPHEELSNKILVAGFLKHLSSDSKFI